MTNELLILCRFAQKGFVRIHYDAAYLPSFKSKAQIVVLLLFLLLLMSSKLVFAFPASADELQGGLLLLPARHLSPYFCSEASASV